MSAQAETPRFEKPIEFASAGLAAAAAAGSLWANDPRPAVALSGDDRSISELARELGEHLASADLYRRGDKMVMTPSADGRGLRVVSENEFRTFVERYLRCFRTRPMPRGEVGVIDIVRTMSRDEAQTVLESPQFLEMLRTVEQVNDVPLPVMRKDGSLSLLEKGYDIGAQTLTLQAATYSKIDLNEARREIDDLLCEFRFADERSRSVAVAAMVSLFAGGLLPAGSLRPAFIYLANAPGAGKTTLADCAVVPVFGRAFRASVPEREEEMVKTLLAAVIAAQPVIFFDNVKRHISSGALENLLSSNYYSGRVLSASQMFSGPNRATLILTGNGCTMSPDIQRRSLICELFSEHARPEDRAFEHRLGEATLLARRERILTALWTFVRHWDESERPRASRVRPGIEDWCDTVGSIVELAGYGCPVLAPALRDGGDTDGTDFAALVRALFKEAGENNSREFKDLVKLAVENGLFERVLDDDADNLDREARARFAKIVAGRAEMIFGGEPPLRFCVRGKGHSRRYVLEVLPVGVPSAVAENDEAQRGRT